MTRSNRRSTGERPPHSREQRRLGVRVDRLLRAISRAAQAAGFRITIYGRQESKPLYGLVRPGRPNGARVYLSSGMHGDEPGGPLAVLNCLRGDEFSRRLEWHICPLLNPAGLERGTRANGKGVDMNRDYHEDDRCSPAVRAHVAWLEEQPDFDLAILMHEDWEAQGFYLNEFKTGPISGLGRRVLSAVEKVCPIDPRNLIDGMRAKRGIVHPFRDGHFGSHWPESFYLRQQHGAATGFNFETPSCLPLRIRLAAQRTALRVATLPFLAENGGEP